MARAQARRFRPLIFALLAVPILGIAMAALGAASLVGMMHLPKWTDADNADASIVSLTARDGAVLKAAWTRPSQWSGRCAIVLHGVGAARSVSTRYTKPLAEHGYATLAPDSRAHGESGGELITYGLLERYDTADWVHWMREQGCSRVFAQGESLGAAVAIMANAVEPQPLFDALVADCAFADLLDTAEYRARKLFPIPAMLSGPLAKLSVTSGEVYSRWRYDLDFSLSSPESAIAKVKTPMLLIHGANDNRTPPEESKRLAAANPAATELWLVEGAGHAKSFRTARDEYIRRMLALFDTIR